MIVLKMNKILLYNFVACCLFATLINKCNNTLHTTRKLYVIHILTFYVATVVSSFLYNILIIEKENQIKEYIQKPHATHTTCNKVNKYLENDSNSHFFLSIMLYDVVTCW